MINKKVTKVISCFFPEDKKQFKIFLSAEYYCVDDSLLKLYNFILENGLNKDSSENFTLQTAFEYTFPKETFSNKKINDKCSDLSLKAEEFLAIQEIKKNKIVKEQLLSQAYEKRFEQSKIEARFKKRIKLLASSPKDEFYYLRKTELLLEHYFCSATKKYNYKKSEQLYSELRTSANILISLLKISIGIEDLARSRIFDNSYSDPILNPILALSHSISDPILDLYRLAFLLVKDEKLDFFIELKTLFFESANDLSRNAKNTFSAIILNYSTRNVKNKLKITEVLEISDFIMTQNLLEIDGYFPPAYFSNICILSTEINSPNTTIFLEFGNKRLNPLEKKSTLAKCWAYHYFAIEKYELAQKELLKVPQTRINDRLQVSVLELRCLFEEHLKGEFTILDYKIEAYKKLIHRNKSLNPIIREQNLNFLYVIKQLHKTVSLSQKAKLKLLNKVETTKIIWQEWLVQKIKNHA